MRAPPERAQWREAQVGLPDFIAWLHSFGRKIALPPSRYLSEMTLALYADPKHPEEAHETYTFSFAYSPDGEAFMTIDAQGDKNKNLRSKTKVEHSHLHNNCTS